MHTHTQLIMPVIALFSHEVNECYLLPPAPHFSLIALLPSSLFLNNWLWRLLWMNDRGLWDGHSVCVCVCVMSSQRQLCSISGVWFISRIPCWHNRSIMHTHTHTLPHLHTRTCETTAEEKNVPHERESWTKKGWEPGNRKCGRRKWEEEGTEGVGTKKCLERADTLSLPVDSSGDVWYSCLSKNEQNGHSLCHCSFLAKFAMTQSSSSDLFIHLAWSWFY